jgi:chromosome segregation ATPase
VNVGKQILTDLTELDKLKKESELNKKEIKELENKITKEEGVIKFLEEKDKNNEVIIKDTEEKVKLLNTENGELRKDIKKMKVKNTVIEIVTGSLVTALTYILVFK